MKQKGKSAALATKIKKWVETVKQLRTEKIIFALPITRKSEHQKPMPR